MTPDDERIHYLESEGGASLSPADRASLDELRTLLRDPAVWEHPDPGLEDRVAAAIAAESGVPPSPAAVPRAARRRRVRVRWPLYSSALVGAAAVAAVVIALTLNAGPSPERLAMLVTGTSLAPGAHGSATLTQTGSGWRIDLSATGLVHLDNGRYYQAWLKNAAGTLVPVGTFNDAAHVTLWSGVPATAFRTLTVTEQLANGNPASSGKRVLIGTIRARS